MKNLIKNLQAANKDLQALSKKVDKIIVQIGKLEKSKPLQKATAKSKPVKKVVAKQAARLTAADTVFGIIKRFKKGTDVATLMKKTGFNRRKIYDNVKILKKQGKIRTAGIGVYIKV